MTHKRTKKEFFDYNEYRDRGMAYKWDTAFAIGELQEGIKESTAESSRDLERLPQQNRKYIEYCLERSIKHNKILEVHLNELDELGRVKEPIWGTFSGFCDLDVLMIGDHYLDYSDIRHVIVHNFKKWSDMSDPDEFPFDDEYSKLDVASQKAIDESFESFFNDNNWINSDIP